MDKMLKKLTEILDFAESKNTAERRKFREQLLDFYSNDDCVEAINNHTAEQFESPLSWNEIMLTVHRSALMDANKIGGPTRGERGKINQSSIPALMFKTIELATKTVAPSLNCDKLMALCFEVWKTEKYKTYHDTYMNILINFVFSNEMYLVGITVEQWREIVRRSLKMYPTSSYIFQITILDALRLVVQYGCSQTHLTLHTQTILTFLESVFQDINEAAGELLIALYKLTYTVCLQIGTENRFALYQFSERCLPPIICFKGCPEMYKMLSLFVQIHHPGGAINPNEDEPCNPCNTKKWKSMMQGIYGSIFKTVKSKYLKLEPHLLKLACEVCKQILKDPAYQIEASCSRAYTQDQTNPRKYCKLIMPIERPIDILRMEKDIRSNELFIQIVTELLRKYPETLKSSDYPEFLKLVADFVEKSADDENTICSLFQLSATLIKNEKEKYYEAAHTNQVEICWKRIWATAVRCIKKNQKSCHELLQLIIKHKNFSTSSIFADYLNRSISWSSSSIESLLILCLYASITNAENSLPGIAQFSKSKFPLRDLLLKWALAVPSSILSTEVPVVALANLLTELVVDTSYNRRFSHSKNKRNRDDLRCIVLDFKTSLENELLNDWEEKASSDIEKCHLAMIYKLEIFENTELLIDDDTKETIAAHQIKEDLFEGLISSLNVLLGKPRLKKREIIIWITNATLVAKIMSNLAQMNIDFGSERISGLVDCFSKAFTDIMDILTTNDTFSRYFSEEDEQLIEALERFYCLRYHRKVEKIIFDLTTSEFIEYLNNLILEKHSENWKINRRSEDRILSAAEKIVIYYSCASIGDEMTLDQKKILYNFIQIFEKVQCTQKNRKCIGTALRFLTALSFSDGLSRNDDLIVLATQFIRNFMSLGNKKDDRILRTVLKFIPRLIKASNSIDSDNGLVEILVRIKKAIANENHGPQVIAEFLKCLAQVISIDPLLNWKISPNSDSTEPIIESLISYIENPFYMVRLESVRAFFAVFSSHKLQVSWKHKFVEKVVFAIRNLLDNNGATTDGRATTKASALNLLAAIIRGSNTRSLQSQALFAIITISVEKCFEAATVRKALLLSSKKQENRDIFPRKLIEMNLRKLLSDFLQYFNNEIEKFPWILTECTSLEDFSKRYIAILLIVKLQRLEFQDIPILCDNIEISFGQTIADCFPSILALLTSMSVENSTKNCETKRAAIEIHEKLRRNSGEFSQVPKFGVLIKNEEKMSLIVVEFVKKFHDQQYFQNTFENNTSLPICDNEPNLNVETMEKCLRSFENDLMIGRNCLIENFVTNNPNVLQEILTILASNINDVKSTDYELLAFHQWTYFYSLVIEKLPEPFFDSMSFYIVKDITHSLLGFIKEENFLSELSCTYFEKFLSSALPQRSNEIQGVLSFIVASLIPVIKGAKVKGALSLLHHLIVKQERILAKTIERLNSFPNDKIFQDIKSVHDRLKYGEKRFFTLEDEIEHFLNATTDKTLNSSLEGLEYLKDQLSSRKDELREMYRKLERLRGFSEDCASSTLHKLMNKLVRLTLSYDVKISLNAAKCLGEVGPADLTTMILKPEKRCGNECYEKTDKLENFIVDVINYLSEFLVDRDIEFRKTCAAALNSIFLSSCKKLSTKSYLHNKVKILYGIDDSTLYFCVYPFLKKPSEKNDAFVSPTDIQEANLNILMESNDLWIPTNYANYSVWIIDITWRFLQCFNFPYKNKLEPICKQRVEFSKMILPRLVCLLINIRKSLVDELCNRINRFFGHLFKSICQSKSALSRDSPSTPRTTDIFHGNFSQSHECVRTMLNVVNCMRIQALENNTSLSFDYLSIAYAADYISAYFTSLLYAELWGQKTVEDSGFSKEECKENWISAIDYICQVEPTCGKLWQYVVREAYLHIGDPDAIYGCGQSDSLDSPTFRTQHYTHLRRWDKVMLEHDMDLIYSNNASARGMLNALQKSGNHHLLGLLTKSADWRSEDNDDFMYETAWRLADWSLPKTRTITMADDSKNYNYHALHCRALEDFRDGNSADLADSLNKARTTIVDTLRRTILECTATMYPILSKLQMLREIEQFAAAMRESDENLSKLINDWNIQDCVSTHDVQYLEPILAQRIAMYDIEKSRGNDEVKMNLAIISTHFQIAKVAEKQEYFPMVSRALDLLEQKMNLSDTDLHNLIYRKARLAWKEGEHDISRCFITDLIEKPSLDTKLRAKALRICGNWMAETKCKSSQIIIDDYYEKSIGISRECQDSSWSGKKTLTDAQADLGEFADAQYQQMKHFMKSSRYEYLEKCVANQDDVEDTSDTDESNIRDTERQKIKENAAEVKNSKGKTDTYLVVAAKNYLHCLQNSNDHDTLIFRMVSLWLENPFNAELNKILDDNFPRVASYKFIALLFQLGPHMSNVSNDFNDKINDLIERCAKEHPHHTLPILFAHKNTYKDELYTSGEGTFRKNSRKNWEPRVIQAHLLIERLLQSEIRPIIMEFSSLCEALIMLAYCKVPANEAKKGDGIKVPRDQAITKIRNFNHTILPTITLDVNPSGNYEKIVGIRQYEAIFKLPGGINEPKNIVCIGTDGIRRRQLVKGRDDLRQDAVMQQVCIVMNSMLKLSREAKRRRLHIRTYKIVPLSRRSGVLEWCENTLPMSYLLTDSGGKKGLHSKYYPNDWKVDKCRQALKSVQKATWKKQLETFLECCKNLHPAFHHFFLEKFPSPEMWFERRLCYTRSVATTSMVGYMLGLGDRHFSNILIDQTTAELIHIDFGVAFAQGKVLSIPETVPFRLTRDMEVAMGICGVEGVMRRCCEETTAVLRERRKILITVLQVLLYDPLFSWAITPVKTKDLDVSSSQYTRGHADDQDNRKTNKIAKKALRVIDEKLQGISYGQNLSIPGQVERLIQQARDPANLCRLFCGWQAYL